MSNAGRGEPSIEQLEAHYRCALFVRHASGPTLTAEAKDRRMSFIAAWIAMEQYGFKDSAKVGDAVPRQAWAFFSKTEKGWQVAN